MPQSQYVLLQCFHFPAQFVLSPYIIQLVHYKVISTTYVVEPKILHCTFLDLVACRFIMYCVYIICHSIQISCPSRSILQLIHYIFPVPSQYLLLMRLTYCSLQPNINKHLISTDCYNCPRFTSMYPTYTILLLDLPFQYLLVSENIRLKDKR